MNVQTDNLLNFEFDISQFVIPLEERTYSIYTDPLVTSDGVRRYNRFHRHFAVGKIVEYFMQKNGESWLSAVRDIWVYWEIGIYNLLRTAQNAYVKNSVATWTTIRPNDPTYRNEHGSISAREVIDVITLKFAPMDHPYRKNLSV